MTDDGGKRTRFDIGSMVITVSEAVSAVTVTGLGSGEGRVSRVRQLSESMDDMRRMLPESFSTAYDVLWTTAYSDGGIDGGAGMGGGGNHPLNGSGAVVGVATGKLEGKDVRVNSGQRDFVATRKRGGPDQTKKVGKTSRTLKDERAYKLKIRIDKQLRKMARAILAELDGKNVAAAVGRVCTGRCKKFGDGEWDFCARCGGPMREMEENEH